MSKNNDQDLYIITEVGTFGELNLPDPSKKKVKTDIEDEIKQAILENSTNLSK